MTDFLQLFCYLLLCRVELLSLKLQKWVCCNMQFSAPERKFLFKKVSQFCFVFLYSFCPWQHKALTSLRTRNRIGTKKLAKTASSTVLANFFFDPFFQNSILATGPILFDPVELP